MMFKKISFISVFVLCFFATSVSAQQSNSSSPTRDNALGQRVNDRIQRLKTDLDTGEIQALRQSCKPAQNKLAAALKVAENYSSSQDGRVNKIISNVTELSNRLKSQGDDIAQLEKELERLNLLKGQVSETYAKYIQALNDSSKIECEANPEGFRTSVDDAKQQFQVLQDLRKELRDLIKLQLKETLSELKGSL